MQAGMFDARPRVARARLHPAGAACRAGARRPAHARQPGHARAGRGVRVRQHAARLAAARRRDRARRAAPLPAAARLRDELPHRQDGDRGACWPSGGGSAAWPFTLRGFMDEFEAAGLIPMSLIRWELTGQGPVYEAAPRVVATLARSTSSLRRATGNEGATVHLTNVPSGQIAALGPSEGRFAGRQGTRAQRST